MNRKPLWMKDAYTIHQTYVLTNIYEYDMSKANISILLSLGWITPELYNELYHLSDKKVREVRIGLMLRDNPEMNQALSDGFKEYRRRLFEANGIQDDEVISIKKDAVFVTRPLMYTKFDHVTFSCKNHYTMFYRLSNLEVWYGEDETGVNLDIKGIKDELLETYDCYFLNMLISIFVPMSHGDIKEALNRLKTAVRAYKSGTVPISAYRELNSGFAYRIRGSRYRAMMLGDEYKSSVDQSYNLMMLGFVKQTLCNLYLGR